MASTLSFFCRVLGVEPPEAMDIPILGCYVDSRQVAEGGLFFALKGKQTDGHRHLSQAASRGAAAAVVAEEYSGESFGMHLVRAADPLKALQQLAAEKVRLSNVKIVAVTGSVGKTTTKGFIATLLEDKFRIMTTPGNQNSQVGMPLALLNDMLGDEELLVLEMAMSEEGNISRLVEIAPPDIALITSVALAHAGNFASLDDIAMSKGEIFKHPRTGVGIFPEDIYGAGLLHKIGVCIKTTYSIDSEEGRRLMHDDRIKFRQKHILSNLLGALTVARCLGFKYDDVAHNFPNLVLPDKRLTVVERNGIIFLNDSYNACAVSVKAALDSMPVPVGRGKRVAVLGEMLELGSFSSGCHLDVGKYALGKVDALFCLGEECRPMVGCWESEQRPVAIHFDRASLSEALKKFLEPGDVVLLKGSSAKEMWKIIDEV